MRKDSQLRRSQEKHLWRLVRVRSVAKKVKDHSISGNKVGNENKKEKNMLSLVSMFACALIRWGILAGVLYIRRRRVGLHLGLAFLRSCFVLFIVYCYWLFGASVGLLQPTPLLPPLPLWSIYHFTSEGEDVTVYANCYGIMHLTTFFSILPSFKFDSSVQWHLVDLRDF